MNEKVRLFNDYEPDTIVSENRPEDQARQDEAGQIDLGPAREALQAAVRENEALPQRFGLVDHGGGLEVSSEAAPRWKQYIPERYPSKGVEGQSSIDPETAVQGTLSNPTYGLTEVAEKTGLYPQYILNLVSRYNVVQPEKVSEGGARETYRFDQRDLRKIVRVKRLTEKGKPIREAAELVSRDDQYQAAAQEIAGSLGLQRFDEQHWRRFIHVLSQHAGLTEIEQAMLMLMEGQDRTLVESAATVGLGSEREAKAVLSGAYSKIGFSLLYLLKMYAGMV